MTANVALEDLPHLDPDLQLRRAAPRIQVQGSWLTGLTELSFRELCAQGELHSWTPADVARLQERVRRVAP